jgi:capsular exopolysaccharide synthesis family protein
MLDKTAHTEVELKRLIDIPVIESIPEIKISAAKKRKAKKRNVKKDASQTDGEPLKLVREIDPTLITTDFAPNYINELFRSMRAKIMLSLAETPQKRIAVTSLNMDEGKSLIAANLAITIAQQKVKTLLIDGDMRRGVIHNMFLLDKKPGLSTLLLDDKLGDENAVRGCIQTTHVPNLHIIASGANIPNPSELLSSPRMADLFSFLSKEFGMIIFDTPPLGVAADAALVGELMSNFVVITKAGSTNLLDLRRKLAEYSIVRKKILGLVLNRAAVDRKLKYYKYSHYNY